MKLYAVGEEVLDDQDAYDQREVDAEDVVDRLGSVHDDPEVEVKFYAHMKAFSCTKELFVFALHLSTIFFPLSRAFPRGNGLLVCGGVQDGHPGVGRLGRAQARRAPRRPGCGRAAHEQGAGGPARDGGRDCRAAPQRGRRVCCRNNSNSNRTAAVEGAEEAA